MTEDESFTGDLPESESHIVSPPAALDAESHPSNLADVAEYESQLDEPAELVDAEPSAEPSVSPTLDAPFDPREDQSAPPALSDPSISMEEWTCEIALWRGDGSATFYARTSRDGEELTIAESPLFRFRGQEEPKQTEEILRAHHWLREQLVRAGWEPSGCGGGWYNHRFRRDFTVAGLIASLTTPISSARRRSNTA